MPAGIPFPIAAQQAWVIHEDKLYMFGGIAGVPMFAKDPAGYITKANQNRSVIPKS